MKIQHTAGGQAEVDEEFAKELIESGQWVEVGAEPKVAPKPRTRKVVPAAPEE